MAQRKDADMKGKTSREVCAILRTPYKKLMYVYYRLGERIPMQKVGRNLVWSPEAVSMAREALAAKRRKETGGPAAEAQSVSNTFMRLQALGSDLRRLGESFVAISHVTHLVTAMVLLTRRLQLLDPQAPSGTDKAKAEDMSMTGLQDLLAQAYCLLPDAQGAALWPLFQALGMPMPPLPRLTDEEMRPAGKKDAPK